MIGSRRLWPFRVVCWNRPDGSIKRDRRICEWHYQTIVRVGKDKKQNKIETKKMKGGNDVDQSFVSLSSRGQSTR